MQIIASVIGAFRKFLSKPLAPVRREPLPKIIHADIVDVLHRCKTDLPPVAGLFWFLEENLSGNPAILTLIQQSPENTDWWGLHTQETIDAWLAQLPTTKARNTFESLYRRPDKEEIVATSALFSHLMRSGSLTNFSMAHVMLRHSPGPGFVGATAMPVAEGFLPKARCENPIGAWMPMFQDARGHTHDLLDAMVFQPDRLDAALDLVKQFAPIDHAEREGYLARQMARFSDILDHDMVQKTGVVAPGVLPDAGMVQSFLLAGACLPISAWSAKGASEVEARATWRPPLMLLLTALDTCNGNSMSGVFADVVKRLMAHGHDVVGKGPQAGPSAAKSLMYFAKIQSHDAVALMLRLGADPDEEVWTTHGRLSVRQFIATMPDARMAHLLGTHKSGSAARSILDDIESEEIRSLSPWSLRQAFVVPTPRRGALA